MIDIITDSISGLVAADKISESKKVNLYIPNKCNFNGFLNLEKNINLNLGARIFELNYESKSNLNLTITNYKPKYKGHINFINIIKNYFDEIGFTENLKLAKNPLIKKNQTYVNDFLYVNAFNDLSIIFDESQKTKIIEKLLLKQQNSIVNSYESYHKKIIENTNYKILQKKILTNELYDELIEPIYKKLCNKEILSEYHRVIWLPLIWTSTVIDSFKNTKKFKLDQFYHLKNNNNLANLVLNKLNQTNNVSIEYFESDNFKIQKGKFFIGNKVIVDSNQVIFAMKLNANHFANTAMKLKSNTVSWNFIWIELESEYLLKEFSQITFYCEKLPYRISLQEKSKKYFICIENGMKKTELEYIIKVLINDGFIHEKYLSKIKYVNDLQLMFPGIPTKNNKNINENFSDFLYDNNPKTNYLNPYIFYQSNAVNEQLALGLWVAEKIIN